MPKLSQENLPDADPPPGASVPSALVVSYKEAVMNDLAADPADDDDLVPLDDDAIDLLDDDVRIEPPQASEVTMVDTPESQPPLDPYGPWMLVDNRHQRPAKPINQPARVKTVPIASHSRFNHIFVETESVEQPSTLADTP
ncbi:hypothetical protein V6N12_045333 [Hibiscus sabdariffa]|uniref:Uncharacterized protein n=1 Tax=Hibiscus sabdariffa TaxID=183260 RepID=A0ABR2G2G0_9ROSI